MSEPVTIFDAASILIVLAAGLGYVNHRIFKLPSSVGLTLMGALASLGVIALDRLVPGSQLSASAFAFLAGLDFHTALMNGMLSFLLFAGALHVDWSEMRRGRWPILVLSTVGVLLSTALVGGGFALLSGAMGLNIPILWCLVFGALISPTDPVAVMGVLKRAAVPPTLQATVAGESLFNDGVGVVVFRSCFRQHWAARRSPWPMQDSPSCTRQVVACCSGLPPVGWHSSPCAASTIMC